MKNLLGEEISVAQARRMQSTPQPAGYAAPPGTGPVGETCGSCSHLFRNRQAKVYLKCDLARAKWTGGRKSDVLARAPACRLWESNSGGRDG